MPIANPNAGHSHAGRDVASDNQGSEAGAGVTEVDPVCGMTVTVTPATRAATFDEKTFHFCSEKCQTKFKGDPWFYASGRAVGRKKAAPANVQYT